MTTKWWELNTVFNCSCIDVVTGLFMTTTVKSYFKLPRAKCYTVLLQHEPYRLESCWFDNEFYSFNIFIASQIPYIDIYTARFKCENIQYWKLMYLQIVTYSWKCISKSARVYRYDLGPVLHIVVCIINNLWASLQLHNRVVSIDGLKNQINNSVGVHANYKGMTSIT